LQLQLLAVTDVLLAAVQTNASQQLFVSGVSFAKHTVRFVLCNKLKCFFAVTKKFNKLMQPGGNIGTEFVAFLYAALWSMNACIL